MTSGDSAGSSAPATASAGTSLPTTSAVKSSPAHESSQARNALGSLRSSERATIRSSQAAGRRPPVVKSMIARRFSARCAASVNRTACSPESGMPEAGTGETPAIRRRRCGATASSRCATAPPIECPTTENRSQPSRSASSTRSTAASAVVYEPVASRASP